MTDDNSTASDGNLVDMDDLGNFENTFFNREPAKQEDASKVDEDTVKVIENETPLETDEDKDASAKTEDDDDTPPQEGKRTRKSAKERIDELTAEKYEARRQLDELRREIEQIKQGTRKTEEAPKSETDVRNLIDENGPNPDSYPLGEFDPKFIADLTKYNVDKAWDAKEQEKIQAEKAREQQSAQEQLKTQWAEKVAKAEEELPELREDIGELVEAFNDVEPRYGEYLATTIMQCENGPQIMHYLSQNIGEARKIVASGPHAATLQIGKLEAMLSKPKEERRNTSASKAPIPPSTQTRGTGGKFAVAPDTDNLDAFEKVFFQKK